MKMMVPLIEGELEGVGRTDDRLGLECARFVETASGRAPADETEIRKQRCNRRGNNRSSAGCIYKLVTP